MQSTNQRSYQRWLNKRIYKMKFWAVLGCLDRREKKTPNCHNFLWAIFFLFNSFENIVASALKNMLSKSLKDKY